MLPWIHSHTSANGTFKPCCNAMGSDQPLWTSDANDESTWYKQDPNATNVARAGDSMSIRRNNMTLSEWFTSAYMDKLRNDLANGVQNPMCGRCWRDETRSGTSIRQRYNSKYEHHTTVEPTISYLDLKLTNQCNLKCRMCGPSDSNLIAQDIVELESRGLTVPVNYANAFGPRRRSHADTNYIGGLPASTLEDIEHLLPQLTQLKVTGGEPTLQPEVLRLFDRCIDNKYAENIELHVTTNATKFTTKFLERIEQFKNTRFNISVDGYGTTYNYIRYPFTWDKFNARIQLLESRYTSSETIHWAYTCVPQMFNIENIHKLQQRVGSEHLYVNNVLHPDGIYNSLDIVPEHILVYALENIEYVEGQSDILINYIKTLLNDYKPVTKSRLADMVKSVTSVDILRNQHYSECLDPLTVKFITESAM